MAWVHLEVVDASNYLVSIHKWPFSAIWASNCGFPCAIPPTAGYVSRPAYLGGVFLDLVPPWRDSFLNWKPAVSTATLMDEHYLIYFLILEMLSALGYQDGSSVYGFAI